MLCTEEIQANECHKEKVRSKLNSGGKCGNSAAEVLGHCRSSLCLQKECAPRLDDGRRRPLRCRDDDGDGDDEIIESKTTTGEVDRRSSSKNDGIVSAQSSPLQQEEAGLRS